MHHTIWTLNTKILNILLSTKSQINFSKPKSMKTKVDAAARKDLKTKEVRMGC